MEVVDDRALLNELSTLNKQIAAFTWRLLDTELTAEEQLALVQRMKDVGEMIRLRVEVSQNQASLPTTDER